jgi:membrane-bound lytic murein transglycosylase B
VSDLDFRAPSSGAAAASRRATDAAFTQFIASLWPEAQAAGVLRTTFDAETRGLGPDDKLPDMIPTGSIHSRWLFLASIRRSA